jgi:hypothetical protein
MLAAAKELDKSYKDETSPRQVIGRILAELAIFVEMDS